MRGKSKAEARKYYNDRMVKIMKTVAVNNDTAFPVIEEAALHVIDHFNPLPSHEFSRDHVLIIGAAYLGDDLENRHIRVNPAMYYIHGNTHELSHTLADCMRDDPTLAKMVFHAMEVFALHPRSENYSPLNDQE